MSDDRLKEDRERVSRGDEEKRDDVEGHRIDTRVDSERERIDSDRLKDDESDVEAHRIDPRVSQRQDP